MSAVHVLALQYMLLTEGELLQKQAAVNQSYAGCVFPQAGHGNNRRRSRLEVTAGLDLLEPLVACEPGLAVLLARCSRL